MVVLKNGVGPTKKKKQKFFKNKLKLVYQTEIFLVGPANSVLQT